MYLIILSPQFTYFKTFNKKFQFSESKAFSKLMVKKKAFVCVCSESINIDMNSDTECKLFYDYIIQALDGRFKIYTSSIPKKQFPRNKGVDKECKQQKSLAHNYSNKYHITIEPHCSYYTKLIEQYNTIKQMKKRNYNKKTKR